MHNIKIFDVRSLPGDSAFLLDDGKTTVLYDSGFAFTGFAVAENIKRLLGERDLDYVFLTHSHYDHALGSVYVSKVWPNVKIVASEYAAGVFAKPSAKKVMRELDRKFSEINGITEYDDFIDELHADIVVNDGDKITAGDMEFTVVSLPGHTKCSVGYYLEESKLLLGSETLGVFDGDKNIIPSYLIGYETTLNSIEKVLALNIENILIPHYGLANKEKSRYYLCNMKRSAVETFSDISAIIKNGGTKDDALDYFKKKFYHGHIVDIYPPDAMALNTSIMIDLIVGEMNSI